MADAALRPAVPFTPAVETIRSDEEQAHRQIADVFKQIIGKTHRDLGHAQRGVHAKSHALLQGRLIVHSALALANTEFTLAGRRDALREEVARILAREGGAWTLRAQLCRDLAQNPIEDASVACLRGITLICRWRRLLSSRSKAGHRSAHAMDDGLSFQPWHGTTDHRPLGDVMRARRLAYPLSVGRRSALNECPVHEPRRLPAL